ncbi:type ISP restriction/modification enzyme [Rothia nasimurium]|uniref:type ISP restriction/modification enzyme n=1 Tax=Rothia nasimurium TaxID=85336 RepID=UPI00162A12A9|nr:type ISP restriction/modification enzyme [Rothia nasimurium]
MTQTTKAYLDEYVKAVKQNLATGIGEPEAQLTTPTAVLIQNVGTSSISGVGTVVTVRETRLDGGDARPDFGVVVDGLLTGHVELKKPGTSLDPVSFDKRNKEQWRKLRRLPNLLYTNGSEWYLYSFGELVAQATVHLYAVTPDEAIYQFERLLKTFLAWEPLPITKASSLVERMGQLAALLREEILVQLKEQRKAKNNNPRVALADLYLLGLKDDWRSVLYPGATDEEFADGFAQTVVFSLIIAVSEGLEVNVQSLNAVSRDLRGNHGLLGSALGLLTDYINADSPLYRTLTIITRMFEAVAWEEISQGKEDVYLHLYEHFLSVYDPELRKKTGSYYTPVEVVDSMVRLTDEALRGFLGKDMGLASDGVAVIDPAMGTGTYPLSVLRSVAANPDLLGPGEVADRVSAMAENLYGFELQSGSFAVAELRISQTIEQLGGTIPDEGLNLYVTDTLEDPTATSNKRMSYNLQVIAQQRILANKVKAETPIQVCIGNPPYKDKSEGLGGWIESGNIDSGVPLADFRKEGNGRFEYVLKNLYVYFWRWAFWKVFESAETTDTGVVCFITADGYLRGPGFAGMREYIRRKTSRGWIINVTPEGKTPPAKNAIFNIETPVTIALFVREPGTSEDTPADIRYIALGGTREHKFKQLESLTLKSERFEPVREGWGDKFTPKPTSDWDSYPAISDLFLWQSPGIKPNKTWVYAPSTTVLETRWTHLVSEENLELKKEMFKETSSTSLQKTCKPLPGIDVVEDTTNPVENLDWLVGTKTVRVGYRSFDRQYLIPDSRLLHRPVPNLWAARIPGQIFVVEQHARFPESGPGLYFDSLIPDMNHFNNRGGRVHPLYHPDGSANLIEGVLSSLADRLGLEVTEEDIVFYLAGITGHSGYVRTFDEELQEAGIRVPVTADPELWTNLVKLGRNIVWLHTYGEAGEPIPGISRIRDVGDGYSLPIYEKAMGRDMPEDKPTWEPSITIGEHTYERVVCFGNAIWSGVDRRVFDYTVGGNNVIGSWAGYRLKSPNGKRTSPLNNIVQETWPREWSEEFNELLAVLTHLIYLEDQQQTLLEAVLTGPLISLEEFEKAGVIFPQTSRSRKPKMPS